MLCYCEVFWKVISKTAILSQLDVCHRILIAFPTGHVPRHIHDLGAKDTAMVVHLENTLVAHRAMVCSWWLWCYTFFTYAGSFRNEGTLKQTRILNKSLYKIFSNFFYIRVQISLTLELTCYITFLSKQTKNYIYINITVHARECMWTRLWELPT
jgi:hypothetical protein